MPQESHKTFIARALRVLKKDPHVLGVAVGGSWLTGKMDEFSDLDLVVVGKERSYDRLMRDRLKIAGRLGKLLSGFTGEHVGEPRLIICLYDAPLLHVDLKFVTLEGFAARIEDPEVLWEREGKLRRAILDIPPSPVHPDLQWIEDRFWVWVHYITSKIGRGELFEALDALAFLRSRVLGPLLFEQRGLAATGVRRLESLVPEALPEFRNTLAGHDRRSCRKALLATVTLYRKWRKALEYPGLEKRDAAEKAAVKYLAGLGGTRGR
ncbi:MAG TPA: nucleotidyltransferase domain-containing protein [bacterium]|nr:nucleotidyltransferase domain-containing protein [bacterium]